MIIKEIFDIQEKKEISTSILESLPNWFGIQESRQEYISESSNLPLFAAIDESNPVGFISVKENNRYTAEIYVMGFFLIVTIKGLEHLYLTEYYNGLKKKDMNSYR